MQQQHTILVIDDDHIELDIMTIVLSTAGYRVLIAEDGESGYRRALFARPDLILLDVKMPGIDGFGTCELLRKNRRTQHIPIFFKTCKGDAPSVVNGYKAGGERFITKPCDHDKLLRMIKSQLASDYLDRLETVSHVLS